MDYWQNIQSETTTAYGGAPVLLLGQCISFTGWLGIFAQTQWEYLVEDEIEIACDTVMRFCSKFIGVAPVLLRGLEFDRISDADEKTV
jgi:hypothetical protein